MKKTEKIFCDIFQKYFQLKKSLNRTDPKSMYKQTKPGKIIEFQITIIIVNWYSTRYLSYLINNLLKQAADPNNIKILIVDNTYGEDKLVKQIAGGNVKIILNDPSPFHYSMAASLGMMKGFSRIDTEYGLIIHPDCMIFAKDWDTILRQTLQKEDVVSIGAPYAPWLLGKYHDYPGPHFNFFKMEEMRSLGFDLRNWPENFRMAITYLVGRQVVRLGGVATKDRLRKNTMLRKITIAIEEKLGIVSTDTGWRHSINVKKSGKKVKLFTIADPDEFQEYKENERIFFSNIANKYELYMWDNKPFVAHLYSTNSRGNSSINNEDRKLKWFSVIEQNEFITEY